MLTSLPFIPQQRTAPEAVSSILQSTSFETQSYAGSDLLLITDSVSWTLAMYSHIVPLNANAAAAALCVNAFGPVVSSMNSSRLYFHLFAYVAIASLRCVDVVFPSWLKAGQWSTSCIHRRLHRSLSSFSYIHPNEINMGWFDHKHEGHDLSEPEAYAAISRLSNRYRFGYVNSLLLLLSSLSANGLAANEQVVVSEDNNINMHISASVVASHPSILVKSPSIIVSFTRHPTPLDDIDIGALDAEMARQSGEILPSQAQEDSLAPTVDALPDTGSTALENTEDVEDNL
ncbi:hypothetical protein B0H13DRAFT_2667474 [Mycena leptocephala]|nr:hypothetical protein B0H13DRAFT_2667474 [Mycena leptocephala]